jgi:hypothetical protein
VSGLENERNRDFRARNSQFEADIVFYPEASSIFIVNSVDDNEFIKGDF